MMSSALAWPGIRATSQHEGLAEQDSAALETSVATHIPAFQVEDALAKLLNCDDAIAII